MVTHSKKNSTKFLTILLALVSATFANLNSASAADPIVCPLGEQRTFWTTDDAGNRVPPATDCEPATWNFQKYGDSFDSGFYIYASPHPSPDSSAGPEDWVAITCSKKKLNVSLLYEYAQTTGWSGTGRVLFDENSAKSFKFTMEKTFKSISLKNPKDFLTKLVKAKKSFAFKVPTSSGSKMGVYAKGNLLTFREQFSKAGCKF
jgi:hypothetical protein